MRPKAIFIDWDRTLSNSRFWERWSASRGKQAQYQQIQHVLFQDAQDLLRDWMRGIETYGSVIDYVARSTGLSHEELTDELRYSCEHMKFINELDIAVIQELRASGTKVLVATDNMDTFELWTIPALGLYEKFDGVLISETQGALKAYLAPDGTSMFFNHYLRQNKLKPSDTLLIDDSLNNKVVENFGMKFLHVNDSASLSFHLGLLAGAA